jgi:hypothetical protein
VDQAQVGQALQVLEDEAVEDGMRQMLQRAGQHQVHLRMPHQHSRREKGEVQCRSKRTNGRWLTRKELPSWSSLGEETAERFLFNRRRCPDELIQRAEKVAIHSVWGLDHGLSILQKFCHNS